MKRLSLRRQKALTGYLFSLPFIIGFIFFFLAPFIQSLIFSMNRLVIVSGGYELEYIKWENFRYALQVDTEFLPKFTETLLRMLVDVPAIIFFAFFAAMLLNSKFRGRLLARSVFFLPVILGSGVVLSLEQTDYMRTMLEQSGNALSGFMSGPALTNFLMQMKIPPQMMLYVIDVVERVPEVIRASGIQILIFLAGLQSISSSLYEAAEVEGASGWQSFWMITLPVMSPIIFANVIYTIIDSFLAANNELVVYIRSTAFGGAGFGVGTAMGVMYFFAVAVVLAIVVAVMSRWVFYQE
ncbi:MAG: sugar ABC transporter permease [Firmicutes bacterium]|nr:sugar ABC transporter permease [Bacillota bacterium]